MDAAYGSMDGLREVCHDIRQPIAGVLALAGAALTEMDLPVNTRSRLEQIIELAEWQSDVVENWLEIAGGGGPPGVGLTDVLRVINEAAAAERLVWPGNLTLVWPSEPRTHPDASSRPETDDSQPARQCHPRGRPVWHRDR